jgi:hypothetical protein
MENININIDVYRTKNKPEEPSDLISIVDNFIVQLKDIGFEVSSKKIYNQYKKDF